MLGKEVRSFQEHRNIDVLTTLETMAPQEKKSSVDIKVEER